LCILWQQRIQSALGNGGDKKENGAREGRGGTLQKLMVSLTKRSSGHHGREDRMSECVLRGDSKGKPKRLKMDSLLGAKMGGYVLQLFSSLSSNNTIVGRNGVGEDV
jgi:hypothetical protein